MLSLILFWLGLQAASSGANAAVHSAAFAAPSASVEAEWTEFDVLSENGLYRAELRLAPGFENKPPQFSRWRLSVLELVGAEPLELWNAQFPYDGSPRYYLLSNDGQTFVHVSEAFQQYRAVMTVFERGRELKAPNGSSFGLAREDTPITETGRAWLRAEAIPEGLTWLETPTGPQLTLELHCLGDHRRWVSVREGRVWSAREFDELFRIEVRPNIEARLAELVATPNVRGFSVPRRIRAGAPLAVRVEGEFVTPGWHFEGFQWSQSGNEGRELLLVPRARRPLNKLVPKELIPFEPTAMVSGLVPGHYQLEVRGENDPEYSPVEFEVLPADLELIVRRVGQPGLEDQELWLYGRGELVRRSLLQTPDPEEPRTAYFSRARLARVQAVLAGLPERSEEKLGRVPGVGRTELTYWRDHQLVEQVRDVTTITTRMDELLALLDELE